MEEKKTRVTEMKNVLFLALTQTSVIHSHDVNYVIWWW